MFSLSVPLVPFPRQRWFAVARNDANRTGSIAFLLHALTALFGLMTLFTLISMRAVWPLMNGYASRIIPLGDRSFVAAFAGLLALQAASLALLLPAAGTAGGRRGIVASILARALLLLQTVLCAGVLAALYPNVNSLYFDLLPSKLLGNGVLPASALVAAACAACWFWRERRAFSVVKTVLVLACGFLLVGVLCMGYMAVIVRGPAYYRNSLDNLVKGGDYAVCSPTAAPRFAADSPKVLKPDWSVNLDAEYGGYFWVAGDLTGDGQVEIVNVNYYVEDPDRNRVASFSVQNLDGQRLWYWKSPVAQPARIGFGRGSSAAFAVYDLKQGAARNKLLMATDGFLFQFDGRTGAVEKKVAVGTPDASDGITIANLRGGGRRDIVLKDAYHSLWAFDEDLNLLWHARNPGGYMLAHRTAAVDLDDDGREEILAGAAILNGDGTVRATLRSPSTPLWYGGHVDGIVPIRQDGKWFIGITYCDASGVGLYDSSGTCLWEVTGEHFEYLIGGYFYPEDDRFRRQFQLMSKVHYKPGGPQVMINQDGTMAALYAPSTTAFSVDWTGDGYHELVFYAPPAIYGGCEKLFDLDIPDKPDGVSTCLRVADFIGRSGAGGGFVREPDGIPDIGVMTEVEGKLRVHLYLNRNGRKPANYVYPGLGWEEAANYFTKYYEYDRDH
jgi:hypothetical protein